MRKECKSRVRTEMFAGDRGWHGYNPYDINDGGHTAEQMKLWFVIIYRRPIDSLSPHDDRYTTKLWDNVFDCRLAAPPHFIFTELK